MSFLNESAKIELQDRMLETQKERHKRIVAYQERMQGYYERVLGLESGEAAWEGKTVDWEKELCQGLRCQKAGEIRMLAPASQKKALTSLLKMERSSEMVFMSFFHTVCKLLREHGEQPPKPMEIMDIQRILFGCKYVMTCDHNIALLAYTLGLLEEGEINGFEKRYLERLQIANEQKERSTLEQLCTTTMLFEQYLDEEVHDMESFFGFLDKWNRYKKKLNWKEELKQCLEAIFQAHGWKPSAPTIYLEQHGCAHMEDTLRRRVLDAKSSNIPQRRWFLEFGLYMGLSVEEVNQLLNCCGYVQLGFEPWEEGLRYLLDNPADNLRSSLDHRESVFVFLKERGSSPPSVLFAAFPYLALQPSKSDHELLAALLLDCCAKVETGSDGELYADFYLSVEPAPWENTGPDLINLFFPREGCPNIASQIRRVLGCAVRMNLPPLKRELEEYKSLSELAQKWQKSWQPTIQTADDEQVMWSLPKECGIDLGYRRKFLYAIFLYIIYTGHLPMKNCSFLADFPDSRIISGNSALKFAPEDEANACRNMVARLLRSSNHL